MKRHLLFVLLLFLVPHGFAVGADGEAARQSTSQDTPPEAAAQPPRDAPSRSQYALPKGKYQIGGLLGANRFWAMGFTKPSLGGEALYGLPHNLAVHGDGSWNRTFGYHGWDFSGLCKGPGLCATSAAVNLYDLGGGLQWSIPNRTRVLPYFQGGPSWIHLGVSARVDGLLVEASGDRFAGSFGGGVRGHLTRKFGLLVDARVFRGIDMPWLVRVSGGFFYQFK